MKGGSVLAKLARAWFADPKGCALLASWAGVFGCVTLRALSQRRAAFCHLPFAISFVVATAKRATALPKRGARNQAPY